MNLYGVRSNFWQFSPANDNLLLEPGNVLLNESLALQLGATAGDLKIGDRLEFIPGYGDLTTVLHNQFYVIHNNRLLDIWPLTARGRLT